ncbi:uncharacterized protein MELLADRAFT_91517 [Melampsora larici-populina 98AG31]|uniref:Uncharacterized protein n=1 Tax=Melampsora larici-populina (strain 98AG31 / pathotype 3-4-7) TaxID=747676 RepID=F4RZC4_MELLP|nr:uncharacterized protein MELLADRAFT_91517 [Melampsora larici-populina 98AG31]EGG02200.1 hypothetical protein MELLADRAFT_91517 [Melampsora larici-populina 98AG31]
MSFQLHSFLKVGNVCDFHLPAFIKVFSLVPRLARIEAPPTLKEWPVQLPSLASPHTSLKTLRNFSFLSKPSFVWNKKLSRSFSPFMSITRLTAATGSSTDGCSSIKAIAAMNSCSSDLPMHLSSNSRSCCTFTGFFSTTTIFTPDSPAQAIKLYSWLSVWWHLALAYQSSAFGFLSGSNPFVNEFSGSTSFPTSSICIKNLTRYTTCGYFG